ncbi:MAG: hypothetical protein QOD81_2606 [Solirubrobacteraceae bacterium]|jgi:hypothetical protein|nr:hypothetical protein [Solirubrobacteraceae bacterium]
MSEQDPRERNPRERPPDPAGTRPRHDPESLLPATREPLLSDDVVDADVVEERETDRGDLLPARRRPGGAAEAVAPARHSQYAPRFHFLTGALAAVGIAALVGLAVFIALPGGGQDPGPRWSTWTPDVKGNAGAQQIAEHVGPAYKLPDGHQMVDVSVTGLEIEGVPLAVAVREAPTQGGDIRVFDDRGLIYRLCGLGPDCAIATGKPSEERHLLLRREALELALYSFRYLEDVHQVVVFMPPALGQKPSQALFFREGDVSQELDRPLTASLSPRVPTVRTITLSPDAPLVDQLTTPKIFKFSLTQANTDNRGFIVLDPFDAAANGSSGTTTTPATTTPATGAGASKKPASGAAKKSSAASGSGAGASG